MPVERASLPKRVLRVGQVRTANRAAVLRLLRRHRQLSRAELARRTGLSEAAISRIIADLMAEDLLVEFGHSPATGGRPGVTLQLNERRFRAVGADISEWETRLALGTATGRTLASDRFRTPGPPGETLARLAEHLERIVAESDEPPAGIGISTRGIVDSRTGTVELGPHPAWVNIGIRRYLAERIGIPIYVENNVRAAALAEYVYGSADIRGIHCLLFLIVATGIGMAIVLDGKMYTGPRMSAGELGQMVIEHSNGPERHDRPGCVERLVSDLATWDRYCALAGERPPATPVGGQQMRQVCRLAMEGDRAARGALAETSKYLGIAIANAVWAMDAEAVVIEGTITEAWPLVSAGIREQFPEGPEFVNFRNLVLRPSLLGGEGSLTGVMTLPFASMFSPDGALV
ncbi:MAG: ROK family protein [Acidobacteriota bacterium]